MNICNWSVIPSGKANSLLSIVLLLLIYYINQLLWIKWRAHVIKYLFTLLVKQFCEFDLHLLIESLNSHTCMGRRTGGKIHEYLSMVSDLLAYLVRALWSERSQLLCADFPWPERKCWSWRTLSQQWEN